MELAKRSENGGNYKLAIKYYNKVAEILKAHIDLYPRHPLSKTYRRQIADIRERIKQLEILMLESGSGGQVAVAATPTHERTSKPAYLLDEGEKPNVRWEDVVGLEDAKRSIIESIVYPSRRPDLFPLGWPRGILLFGPPGCGKTMLAAAVVNEIDAYIFHIDAASIMSKWLGESERNIAAIFREAREYERRGKPVIILIDEVDALASTASQEVGGEIRMRRQLLKEMDGLLEKGHKRKIYVLGTTNTPWRLDIPFIRRFQKRIYVPPPDYNARVELFKMYSRPLKIDASVSFEKLAEMTRGYSGSDILDVCRDAHMRVIRELFERRGGKGEPRPITMDDFKAVLRSRKPSISPDILKRYEEWYRRYKAI